MAAYDWTMQVTTTRVMPMMTTYMEYQYVYLARKDPNFMLNVRPYSKQYSPTCYANSAIITYPRIED